MGLVGFIQIQTLTETCMADRSINSTSSIYRTTRASIDLRSILNLNLYAGTDEEFKKSTFQAFVDSDSVVACAGGDACEVQHEHHHTRSSTGEMKHGTGKGKNDITTISIPLPILDDVRTGAFDRLIRGLLWDGSLPPLSDPPTAPVSPDDKPDDKREFDILRTKAFLRSSDGSEYILQGVRDIYEITQVPKGIVEAGIELERIVPKLVLIGRGIDGSTAERFLSALRAEER